MKWAYGVTTVPQRRDNLLVRTLESLKAGGFPKPRLFVDGAKNDEDYKSLKLEVTVRNPKVRTAGHWMLTLLELYIRNPQAERYAIFQDDLITYQHLRQYLEKVSYDPKTYWNLYTFPKNQELAPTRTGWFKSNQRGKGAVALIFDRETVTTLLGHKHLLSRPQDPKGHQTIDGGIVTSLKKAGWVEHTHNPSLVQHTGNPSTMGHGKFPEALSFRGERFNALSLLPTPTVKELAPPVNPRWDRFLFTEALGLLKTVDDPLIVEIGGIRDGRPIAARADGHSTVHWAKSGYQTICVDKDPKSLRVTRKLIGTASNVELHQGDGLAFLKELKKPIDLLYLDGPDPKSGGVEFPLRCLQAATLSQKAVILVDDCDVTPGKGDLVIPAAVSDGFEIVKQDRQCLLFRDSLQTDSGDRVGIIGYRDYSGLGELNRQIATYLPLSYWLQIPHRRYPTLSPFPHISWGTYNKESATDFLSAVDVVLFCETPFYPGLLQQAKDQGKRIVCVPMLEWTPSSKREWVSLVDCFVCPTKQCYQVLKGEGLPVKYFPWPVDTGRFRFRKRETCKDFVYVHGTGGWQDRKGFRVIKDTVNKWPDIPLKIFSYDSEVKGLAGLKVLSGVDDNRKLYDFGDVLLVPHAADGVGLGPIEAMCSGIPVVTPDAPPWNENPAIARIEVEKTRRQVKRMVDWYKCSSDSLVTICKSLLGTDILEASQEGRQWAECRSWIDYGDEMYQMVTENS